MHQFAVFDERTVGIHRFRGVVALEQTAIDGCQSAALRSQAAEFVGLADGILRNGQVSGQIGVFRHQSVLYSDRLIAKGDLRTLRQDFGSLSIGNTGQKQGIVVQIHVDRRTA